MDNKGSNKIPLCILIEQAKGIMFGALEKTINETKLPAYLIEGVMFEVLANIKNQKNIEVINELNTINNLQEEVNNENTTGNNT